MCNFNAFYKIHPRQMAIWRDVMLANPHTVLVLRAKWGAPSECLVEYLAGYGMGPERIHFTGDLSGEAHSKRCGACDLVVDTDNFNGITTTATVLWTGTPVLPLRYVTLRYVTLRCLILPYVKIPYLARPYHTLPELTLPCLTSPHLTLPYLTLPYLTLPYLPYLTLPYLTLPYLTNLILPCIHEPQRLAIFDLLYLSYLTLHT